MVATPSAAAQTSEMERKRKQTLERTKANHLSRQLQMRLQYARLKVEHGWQRQNLNEVENLYFHHSHRGTKTHRPRPSLVVITSDDNPLTLTSSNQLDVSYKPSMSRSATLDAFLDSSGQRTNLSAEAVPASTPTPPALLSQIGVGSHGPLATSSASSAIPEVQTSQLRENSHTSDRVSGSIALSLYNERSGPEATALSGSPSQPTAVTESTAAIANPTPQRSNPRAPTSFGNVPSTRTSSVPTPVSASPMNMPLLMHKKVSSFAKNDKFSLNKPATLTYDSFWSGMQSKSYPALKNGGTGLNTQLSSSVPNITTATTTPNLASSSASPSPRPFIPSYLHHPLVPSSITSSATPALSLPPASTPTPAFPLPTTSFTSSTPSTQQLQFPMQQNRLFLDSLAAWNLIASHQTPGSINAQQNFITGPLVSPVMAYPCLASLTAPYAQAFGVDGEIQGGQHSQGVETSGASSHGVATPPVVVPPSNTSSVTSPVVSTLVRQEGS